MESDDLQQLGERHTNSAKEFKTDFVCGLYGGPSRGNLRYVRGWPPTNYQKKLTGKCVALTGKCVAMQRTLCLLTRELHCHETDGLKLLRRKARRGLQSAKQKQMRPTTIGALDRGSIGRP